MKYLTDDIRITGMEEVIAPSELLQEIADQRRDSELIFSNRQTDRPILRGEDPRLLVIIGPCSIHDPAAALEYADRLANVARGAVRPSAHPDARLLRETANHRRLEGTHQRSQPERFLRHQPRSENRARTVLRDIAERGLGTATEYLDPITPQYLGDLVSWGAIGARTTESQIHRQLASGLSCPIGFKNSTDGSIQVAVDAIKSAAHSHIFLSVTKQGHSAIFSTAGNEDCHVILRGGAGKTNFDNPSVHYASRLLDQAGLNNRVMVDMSHANSEKDHRKQMKVCKNICGQLSDGESRIFGVMIESNLVEGNQSITEPDAMTYGCSVTDACISWEDSDSCLRELAAASEKRMLAS